MMKKSILVMAFLTLSIILAGCSGQDSGLNLIESDETQEGANASDEIEETFEEEFVDENETEEDVEIGQLY